jgi:hypothetical protein
MQSRCLPMRVTRLLDEWPEAKQRRREWFTLAQAALQVEEEELVTMLLRLAAPPREVVPASVAADDALRPGQTKLRQGK